MGDGYLSIWLYWYIDKRGIIGYSDIFEKGIINFVFF